MDQMAAASRNDAFADYRTSAKSRQAPTARRNALKSTHKKNCGTFAELVAEALRKCPCDRLLIGPLDTDEHTVEDQIAIG